MSDTTTLANLMSVDNDATLPTYRRPELLAVGYQLDLMMDLLGGTSSMHKKATTYIRKWTDEEIETFNIRSVAEQVLEGLGRALSASVGMMFAREPNLDWKEVDETFQDQWESVDGSGTAGHVFVKKFSETAVRDGVAAILVDHTPLPRDAETGETIAINAREETERGVQPTWASYPRSNILSWHTEEISNRETLVQAVLYEPSTVRDGAFGVKSVDRFRALVLANGVAGWILFEATEENPSEMSHFKIVKEGVFRNKNGQVADFIPLAIAHTGRSDEVMVATIPLLGVAYANLGHWQLSTNLRFYIDLLSFPQPWIRGALAPNQVANPEGDATTTPGKLKVGPMVFIHLTGENSEYGFASPSPDNYEPIQASIRKKEEDMALQGLSFLARDKRAAETAEAKRLDATAENASLATAAQGIDDAVNQALGFSAWYNGVTGDAPVFTINRDFESTTMSPEVMAAYVAAVEKAGLPIPIFLQMWQDGGRIPPDTDLEELEVEMMAILASQEQERREAEETAAARLEAARAEAAA